MSSRIEWLDDFGEAQARALKQRRLILISVTKDL
jgi:hypothetical protein